uniref:Uncharacterized mitochondrial protein AtMg00810-like n=1 Tax=Tanacetum cinerariifolium TaxID=118510 RepID=A0A699GYK0_TANCI|nr:uncharacterized mitochondrial protein AtMg00810-like [Tanacetum cinerariifolium]
MVLQSSHDDGSRPSSDDGKKIDEDPSKESEYNDQEKEDNVNNTNNANIVSSTVNAVSINEVNADGVIISSKLPFDSNMHALENISIFNFSNDDEDDGKIDKTLFIKRPKGDILLVQVYVDDIIFSSTKKELCIAFKKLMPEKFHMSSMGELTFFLGLQVKQKKNGIFISQYKYVAEILKKFRFIKVKTASTPIEIQKPLLKDEDGEEVDVHMYRSMIGSLMYLTSSRPDIMSAVCTCARYQVNPKVSHLHVVKRIFRYLKGQPKLGLWYPKYSPFDLVAYTDSDYAGASLDKKSTIEDCNEKKLIQMVKIHTDKNVADLLTKAFDAKLTTTGSKLMMLVAFFSKPTKSDGFEQIVDFLNARPIREAQIHARVDGKKIILTESSVRRDLQLQMRKELGDNLVRAATTASSLEAEQDSSNIKNQFKATPNESSSQGTYSGGGPRCQETMEDTTAQTRFESVYRHFNDSLLARESSGDEESLGADASKQGRIKAIDVDEEIILVNVQDYAKMFDVNALDGKEVFVARKNKYVVEEVVDAAQVSTATTTLTITTEEMTLAQALEALKNSKPKAKGIFFKIQEEERLAREKAKREQEANISLIETWNDIQAMIDADHQLAERLQKIYKKGKKTYYQTVRANGKSQMYMVFSKMLKSFDREDLKDLYKLVKAKFKSTRLVEDLDLLLWGDLKTMFEPHVEDEVYMLVEKTYPLATPTLSMMLEKKLQVDSESEMAYQLCKLIIKQLKK